MIFFNVQRVVCVVSGVVGRIGIVRNFGTITVSQKSTNTLYSTRSLEFCSLFRQTILVDHVSRRNLTKKVQDKIPAVQMKKRPSRKKRLITDDEEVPQPGFWNVKAMATAEEYNLESLMEGLIKQDLYAPSKINTSAKCESIK